MPGGDIGEAIDLDGFGPMPGLPGAELPGGVPSGEAFAAPSEDRGEDGEAGAMVGFDGEDFDPGTAL